MTTKRLEQMAALLRPPPKRRAVDMRPRYQQALQQQGWTTVSNTTSASEYSKGNKRMRVENGDRVFISINGITWIWLNQTARKRLLLNVQAN